MNNLVEVTNNKATTTSTKVAEYFGKRHSAILKNIDQLQERGDRINFEPIFYQDKYGRSQKAYQLDKDAFVLLTMGFTGQKAYNIKVDYIKAFNEMEEKLEGTTQQIVDPSNAQFWLNLQNQQTQAIQYLQDSLSKKEQENKELEKNNILLASQDLTVTTKKDYKWKEQVVQNNRGRTINYYVNKYFTDGDYAEGHRKSKSAYKQATGITLPKAKYMSIDQKKDYLDWLSKYEG